MTYRQRQSRKRGRGGVRSKALLALVVVALLIAIGALSVAGYVIAVAMVETRTGEAWEEALGTQIFSQLGLDGQIGWPALHASDAPLGHRLVDGKLQPHDPATDPYALPAWMAPAGDVSLSIGDYGVFLADQLAGLGGRGRLGAASLYQGLHTPDPPDDEGDLGYARGWGVRMTADGPMSMHTGSAETFYAVAVLAPDRDLGVALVANAYSEDVELAVNGLLRDLVSVAPG
jgi:D-alanyl-D-alanine carboxypeptidase